jgi:hypothetical protein
MVTIERHSPDRLLAGPLYMGAPRTRGLAFSRVILLRIVDNRIRPYSTKKRTVLDLD